MTLSWRLGGPLLRACIGKQCAWERRESRHGVLGCEGVLTQANALSYFCHRRHGSSRSCSRQGSLPSSACRKSRFRCPLRRGNGVRKQVRLARSRSSSRSYSVTVQTQAVPAAALGAEAL